MFIAGLTGGAGCGKSTFRELFCRDSLATFLDADQIVRQLLDGDGKIKRAIQQQISSEAYDSSGAPDRALLRDLIYQNPETRRTLESILHPVVREYWHKAALEARTAQRSLVVEIPLLFEKNLETEFDCSILVAATPETQLQRLASRGINATTARQMLSAQLTNEKKIPRASHVIWNDGSRNFLAAQSSRLAQHLTLTYGN